VAPQCKLLDQLGAWEAAHGHAGLHHAGQQDAPVPGTIALSTNFFNSLSVATLAISERAQHFSILVADGMLQGRQHLSGRVMCSCLLAYLLCYTAVVMVILLLLVLRYLQT
jgi:hypothetical protein